MGYGDLENIVNKHVKAYKTDFYDYDVPTLNNPEERYYVWIVRTNGTHLIPKSMAASNDTLHYWMDNATGTGNDVNYYEIDTDTMTPTYISNIEQYISRCREETELTEMYSSKNDFSDIDYDY